MPIRHKKKLLEEAEEYIQELEKQLKKVKS